MFPSFCRQLPSVYHCTPMRCQAGNLKEWRKGARHFSLNQKLPASVVADLSKPDLCSDSYGFEFVITWSSRQCKTAFNLIKASPCIGKTTGRFYHLMMIVHMYM
ncbi:hypothetical protein ATANTOWER_029737 [Ataeniobius toweri]|uniref:Uncharacterized protein n=1 Tax=Ataeniobius toweri TaxID=208326 RepID=A0ABU7CGY7_9TELE|nr:hypothetical protein [Ataeniobius toweri]